MAESPFTEYLKVIEVNSVRKDGRWKPPEPLTPHSVRYCIAISSHVYQPVNCGLLLFSQDSPPPLG